MVSACAVNGPCFARRSRPGVGAALGGARPETGFEPQSLAVFRPHTLGGDIVSES